jgi:hypothetical protein
MAQSRGIEVFAPLGRNLAKVPDAEPRATAHLGFSATVLAAGLLFVLGYAMAAAVDGDASRATSLAWIAIVGSIVTGLMGAVALVGGYGRLWGFVAIVLSVIANPTTLQFILGFFGSL